MHRSGFVWVAIACIAILAARLSADDRSPEPTTQAIADAEKLVKDVHKDDYAKRGPDERRALAVKLLEEGRDTKADPASQYVLLRESCEMATQVADVETAMSAVDEMAKAFVVDPVDLKLKALTKMKSPTRSVESCLECADATMGLLDQSLAADNFEVAGKAADLMLSFATGGKNMQMVAAAQARKSEIKAWATAYMEMKIGEDKLQRDPKDATAKLAVGLYEAFYKSDWDKALPLLAEGSDVSLAAAAKADVASPVDVAEMVKVGDGWWDLGMSRLPLKQRILVRAEFWYNLALPSSEGLMRAKLEKRIADLAAMKPGGFGAVSEATRKLLPTPTELQRLKEAVAAANAGDFQKQQEVFQERQVLSSRLHTDYQSCNDSDFFARCKADQQIHAIVGKNDGFGTLIQSFSTFAMNSKSKEEFVQKLLGFERFNMVEKVLDQNNLDSIVYSSIRNFANAQHLLSAEQRTQLGNYLKQKGVKSGGVDRYLKMYTGRMVP